MGPVQTRPVVHVLQQQFSDAVSAEPQEPLFDPVGPKTR